MLSSHQDAATLPGIAALFKGKQKNLAKKIRRKDCPDCLNNMEKLQLAMELLLTRNKVTHIYEMIKAYGSSPQVTLDRGTKNWNRTPSIAVKHGREYSVNPHSGKYGRGEEHAPLIHAGDPRANLPSKLRKQLFSALQECDPRIVKGWLDTALADMPSGDL